MTDVGGVQETLEALCCVHDSAAWKYTTQVIVK